MICLNGRKGRFKENRTINKIMKNGEKGRTGDKRKIENRLLLNFFPSLSSFSSPSITSSSSSSINGQLGIMRGGWGMEEKREEEENREEALEEKRKRVVRGRRRNREWEKQEGGEMKRRGGIEGIGQIGKERGEVSWKVCGHCPKVRLICTLWSNPIDTAVLWESKRRRGGCQQDFCHQTRGGWRHSDGRFLSQVQEDSQYLSWGYKYQWDDWLARWCIWASTDKLNWGEMFYKRSYSGRVGHTMGSNLILLEYGKTIFKLRFALRKVQPTHH